MSPLALLCFASIGLALALYVIQFVLKSKCKKEWVGKAAFYAFLFFGAASTVLLPLYLRKVFADYNGTVGFFGGLSLALCFSFAFFAPYARKMPPIVERLAVALFLLFGAAALGCLCYEGRIMLNNESVKSSTSLLALFAL